MKAARYIAAALVWATVIALFTFLPLEHWMQPAKQSGQPKTEAADRHAEPHPPTDPTTAGVQRKEITSAHEQRQAKGGGDQRETRNPSPGCFVAWWNHLIGDPVAVGTYILAALTFGILVVYIGLFKIGRAQTNASIQQLEAYERPWITATISIGSGVFLLGDGRIGIAVTPVLANVGKSVAVDVDYRLELTRLLEPEDIDALPDRIAVLQRRKPSGSGFSIFPGEHVENMLEGYDLPAVPSEVQPVTLQWLDPFVCIGAVFYSFANSKTEHTTGFACLLRIVNAGERIKENLAAGASSIHLTPGHVEVMPQRHLTRAN